MEPAVLGEYYTVAGTGTAEIVDRRSRFLGAVAPAADEQEAQAFLAEIRREHWEARHHVYAYVVEGGRIRRCSDDGEPQGTGGKPVLDVVQGAELMQCVAVVTRYFGGILLGAGGLVRAYTQSAKDALDAAGISVVRRWTQVTLTVPYSLFERVKLEAESLGGVLGEPEYAAEVTMPVLLPEEKVKSFTQRITEITAGGVVPAVTGERLKDVPR